MRRSLSSRIAALVAATVLCLSPAGQAVAHAEAHTHLAEHADAHPDHHAGSHGLSHHEHDTDGTHTSADAEDVQDGPGLYAADHPSHSHVVIGGATVKRESIAADWSVATAIVVQVLLPTDAVIEPVASAIDAALLPRPGPEPGRQRGPRPPPVC